MTRLSKKGAIIIVSLWALVVLSIIAVSISRIISPQIKLARSVEERTASLLAAEAVERFVYLERRNQKEPDYDSSSELSGPRQIKLGKTTANYSLVDEESKVDINSAAKDVIMRLPGLESSDVTDKIISQRALRPFAVIEELPLIEGVTADDFSQFKNLITVFSTHGLVNINTASESVLAALGLSAQQISSIMEYRRANSAFKSPGEIDNNLPGLGALRSLLIIKSAIFEIDIQTKFLEGQARNFKITVDTRSDKNKILRWQEP